MYIKVEGGQSMLIKIGYGLNIYYYKICNMEKRGGTVIQKMWITGRLYDQKKIKKVKNKIFDM